MLSMSINNIKKRKREKTEGGRDTIKAAGEEEKTRETDKSQNFRERGEEVDGGRGRCLTTAMWKPWARAA
jgi:hypothetical protein